MGTQIEGLWGHGHRRDRVVSLVLPNRSELSECPESRYLAAKCLSLPLWRSRLNAGTFGGFGTRVLALDGVNFVIQS